MSADPAIRILTDFMALVAGSLDRQQRQLGAIERALTEPNDDRFRAIVRNELIEAEIARLNPPHNDVPGVRLRLQAEALNRRGG